MLNIHRGARRSNTKSRCPILVFFDLHYEWTNTMYRLVYVLSEKILLLGCRMLILDGQTPTSGRFCRVSRLPI